MTVFSGITLSDVSNTNLRGVGINPLHEHRHEHANIECKITKSYMPSNQEIRELNIAYSLHNISDLGKRKDELVEITFSNEMVRSLIIYYNSTFLLR
jgi:hypothetical protein